MSKGLGKIERAILDALKEGHGSLNILAAVVAEKLGQLKPESMSWNELRKCRGTSWKHRCRYTEAFYRSVARAVRNLEEKNLIFSIGGSRDYEELNTEGVQALVGKVGRVDKRIFLGPAEDDEDSCALSVPKPASGEHLISEASA